MDVPKKISGKWRRICKKILKQYENINASICTIAADGPWSNGPIERHNEIIGPTFTKIIEETNCELSFAWVVNANNSQKNVYGFSPNQ